MAFLKGPSHTQVVSCLVEPFFGIGGHVLDSACLAESTGGAGT
jgi:hypothetical protein